MKSIENLDIYNKSRDFRRSISGLVKKIPINEKYRLTDQIIRSSRSISANIAEGYGRFHYQESIQFFRIARGSLLETQEHLRCAFDEKYINKPEFSCHLSQSISLLRQLNGYINYMKKLKSNT